MSWTPQTKELAQGLHLENQVISPASDSSLDSDIVTKLWIYWRQFKAQGLRGSTRSSQSNCIPGCLLCGRKSLHLKNNLKLNKFHLIYQLTKLLWTRRYKSRALLVGIEPTSPQMKVVALPTTPQIPPCNFPSRLMYIVMSGCAKHTYNTLCYDKLRDISEIKTIEESIRPNQWVLCDT